MNVATCGCTWYPTGMFWKLALAGKPIPPSSYCRAHGGKDGPDNRLIRDLTVEEFKEAIRDLFLE